MTNNSKNKSNSHFVSDARDSNTLLSCICYHLSSLFQTPADVLELLAFYYLFLEVNIKANPDLKQFSV